MKRRPSFFRESLSTGASFTGHYIPGDQCSIAFCVPYGEAHSTSPIEGIPHALEHMLFKARTNERRVVIAKKLDACGSDLNAFTTHEATAVYCTVPSDYTLAGVATLSELLKRPTFTSKDLRTELKVIAEEVRRCHDDLEEYGSEKLDSTMYKGPFGRNIRGSLADVREITSQQLHTSWEKHYDFSALRIICFGAFDRDRIRDKLEKILSRADFAKRASQQVQQPKLVQVNRQTILYRPGIEQAHMTWGTHIPSWNESQHHAIQLLDNYLVGGTFSFLFNEIREKLGLVYRINGAVCNRSNHGNYRIVLSTQAKNVGLVTDLIHRGFMKATTISSQTLEKVKKRTLGAFKVEQSTPEDVLEELIEREMYGPGSHTYHTRINGIQNVTLEEVRTLAAQALENNSLVTITPRKPKGI